MGFVAVLVGLVLVVAPIELSAIAPEPIDEELEVPMLSELAVIGAGAGAAMGAGLVAGGVAAGMELVSSTFLPQAPNASNAAIATAVAAAGLILDANM
ncbi:MAG: hypothetical protein V4614_18630 [Pseudomonadota bacterium]